MVEMEEIENEKGIVKEIEGMKGKRERIEKIRKKMIKKEEGGVIRKRGVVDY